MKWGRENDRVEYSSQALSLNMSCIVMLDGSWYDLTSVLHTHPGGPHIIQYHHGKDGTRAFYRYKHSTAALDTLAKYKMNTTPTTSELSPNSSCMIQ